MKNFVVITAIVCFSIAFGLYVTMKISSLTFNDLSFPSIHYKSHCNPPITYHLYLKLNNDYDVWIYNVVRHYQIDSSVYTVCTWNIDACAEECDTRLNVLTLKQL